jgi:hypothetical protein
MPNAAVLVDPLDHDLEFECPHCQLPHNDEFELLDHGTLEQMVCEQCRTPFWLLLLHCTCCAEETLFSWVEPPPGQAMAQLFCMKCGHSLGTGGSV